jgi:hypothetical protein
VGGFWDEVGHAFKDQMRGALKHGPSTSYGHNRAAYKAARAERLAREDRAAREMARVVLADLARRVFRESQKQKGRDVQFVEDGINVLVKNGYSRQYDEYTTDVIVTDPARRDEHLHVVFGEDGREIFNDWRPNH